MAERKFGYGDRFKTPDGEVKITGVVSENDGVVYAVKYLKQEGNPVSPLSEAELLNNEEITKIEE